jgi:outer membrane lipoprotein SlyB
MKKFIATFIVMVMMAVILPIAASAQTYTTKRVYSNGRWRTVRVYKKPSFYRRHRNASNIAIGTGAGALIGAIAGGKKGALIGTAVGAGGSALYTYKIKPKKRRYVRGVRRY